jgi:hypothetical protein
VRGVARGGGETVSRDVNLYLLINTDLGWSEDLLSNESFSSLAHTCTQLRYCILGS